MKLKLSKNNKNYTKKPQIKIKIKISRNQKIVMKKIIKFWKKSRKPNKTAIPPVCRMATSIRLGKKILILKWGLKKKKKLN